MKQQKLTDYRPNYPKKALRGAAMTAAALVVMGGMAGCVRVKVPGLELQTEGMVAVTEPPEEVLVLDGEVTICEPEETPDPQELTTTGMVDVPEDNDH